jgi:glycosyltransferase involved in cell wall biosynthesis
MKISYVLPIYNGQNTANQCIKGLLKQEVKPHEIIVINDGSDDFTQKILDFHADNITIVEHKERKGGAFCRNLGNDMATGDIIAVCDVDFYYAQRSTAIEEFFTEFKEKSVFYSGLYCRSSLTPTEQWQVEAFEWDFKSKCPISHPTVAYRREMTKEIKYHEDSIDTDLYEFFLLDANKKGYLMGGCQNPLMIKIEGDTVRDRSDARKLKIDKYKEYGIEVDM